MKTLARKLVALDGRGYKAYKDLRGRYRSDELTLFVDHVQGDPYAAPSRLRAVVAWKQAQLPQRALENAERRRATRDFLARAFARAARGEDAVSIDAGHQSVLERSACLLTDDGVELRFRVDLPGRGRRILGHKARHLLCESLPRIALHAASPDLLDLDALKRHCDAVEDQVALREALADAGLVAFLGDGALLPRRSGVDDRPAERGVRLEAPESLRVTLSTPNSGEVSGLGMPRGITLFVGGGFHGKSTLLRAVEQGIYDHVPGDGRERVVTEATAVKIRAEDGRCVAAVDISPFIGDLPGGQSTVAFTTDLASGSTSQAAALVEALESGCRTLLVDEDTSATNFMIRDERMQALVPKEIEPITPFVDRVRELRDGLGVSTVLVMGGSGDYFDHADTVIRMESYRPFDVTEEARQIAEQHATGRREEHGTALEDPVPRRIDASSLKPERKPGRVKVQARGLDTLVFGRADVDLSAVEQLVDPSQLRTIGALLVRLSRERSYVDPLTLLGRFLARCGQGDWDELPGHPDGDLALVRVHEAMAALSRLRGIRCDKL